MEKYTDQEFFYKQTPVNYDGIAKFTSIKGNTLVWNQLVQNGNFANTANWTVGGTSFIVSNNEATFTGNQYTSFSQPMPKSCIGHKVLAIATCKTDGSNSVFKIRKYTSSTAYTDSNEIIPASYQTLAQLISLDSNLTGITVMFQNNASESSTINVKNVMLFDLTQMGLDITDPSEFPFSLPYYDYNQGTLIPFSGNGIKTTANLLETSKLEIGKNWTYGSASNRAIWQFDCQPETEYHIDLSYSSAINNAVMVYKSGYNTNQLSNVPVGTQKSVDIITPSGCYVVCIQFESGTSVMTTDDIYSQCRAYLKGKESTTDLPISTYFPTGMKSAGSVYDELTPMKAITRIGVVDLGSLTWAYRTTGSGLAPYFYASFNGIKSQGNPATNKANLICSKYQDVIRDQTYFVDKTICADGSPTVLTQIQIKDSSYTDATAFKNSLQGQYLYYEMVTETETDAEDIFYKFYADGTEQLLPVNESSPSTSYLIADIEYYDSTEGDSLYRRFWLINGDGERWDLTDKEFRSFLNNPTGLGFRKTIEITRYGEKANKNNEVYDFPQPSGELLFYDTYNSTRYDKYNKFIRFLMSQPITLYYMIPVSYISGIANIFTLNCDVTEVQKTESKTDHILTSSIVFNGLGFYEGDEISVNGTTDTYTLTNEGDFPVGFEITVEGSLTKPYITLSQDGELYGEAKFDSATAFNSLYIDSNDGEQNIILQQGGSVIPNPLSYQDLSISNGSIYVTFVKLAKGVSELSIGVESGSITNVNIKYSPKYRSV